MTDEELRVRAIQELEFYKKDDTFWLADITVDLAIKALEQMPKILETLDFAIDASNGETNYFVGFRNGLRYSKLLIDGEEPQFEHCTEQEPKTGHCKDCKWWRDSDGTYCRGVHAESKCPINRKEVYEGNGYCYMFEPQESEGECKNCEYYRNPDYTRCHECKAESEDKE